MEETSKLLAEVRSARAALWVVRHLASARGGEPCQRCERIQEEVERHTARGYSLETPKEGIG